MKSRMSQGYDAVPRDESNTDEKEDNFRQLTRSTWVARLRTCALAILGTLLLASLIVNILLIHRQFIRPWDLARGLPSRFGTVLDFIPPVQCRLKHY